jgi:excisionase family DNA binding protein
MKMEVHSIVMNSEEAARVLGVNVSSIKRWTDEGKLTCIKTAGGHRKFQMKHLADFLERNNKKTSKLNVFSIENAQDLEINYHILKGDFEYLIPFVIRKALQANRDDVQNVFTGLYLSQYPLYQIYDDLVTPALHEIGDRWMQNKLSITEEHIGTHVIRDCIIRLQGIIKVPRKKHSSAVCLNLSSELHDIALKMVQNLLELRGLKTYFSGQKTPYLDLEMLLKKIKPDRLYISSTLNEDTLAAQSEIDFIFNLCSQFGTKVFIGGTGFDQITFYHPVVAQRLSSFKEVYEV